MKVQEAADGKVAALAANWSRIADYLFGRNALIGMASIMLLVDPVGSGFRSTSADRPLLLVLILPDDRSRSASDHFDQSPRGPQIEQANL